MTPAIGETTIGMTTLSRTPAHFTVAPAASAAPTSPPISACEDDDGRPYHQVSRFQPIAPISAAPTRRSPCVAGRGVDDARCRRSSATFAPKNAPKRLATAAMASAMRGVSARVETEVAIALAASWKPLV